jgi:hypothetical protein
VTIRKQNVSLHLSGLETLAWPSNSTFRTLMSIHGTEVKFNGLSMILLI